MSIDPYAILGLPPGKVNAKSVNQAFKARLSATHPDHGGSEEKMSELNQARDILLNPERKKRFDELGSTDSGQLSIEEQAKMYIGNLFAAAIDKSEGDSISQILQAISIAIGSGLEAATKLQRSHPNRLRRAKAVINRIKSCDPIIKSALEMKLERLEISLVEINQQVEVGRLMLKLMQTIKF